MKFSKLNSLACCFLFTVLSHAAEGEITLKEEEQNKSDSFQEWLAQGESRLVIGNFTSFGVANSDSFLSAQGKDGNTAGYSSTYVDGFYETPEMGKFQIGIGAQFHFLTLDHNDVHDSKYPSDQDVFLTDTYVKYNATEKLMLQAGRFDVRGIANRFDPQYGEGLYLAYKASDKLEVHAGAISKLAYFYNDFVREFEAVDDASRLETDEAGGVIYFAEVMMGIGDKIDLNPYLYYQEDYIAWYGVDTKLSLKRNDREYGLKLYTYYLDVLIDEPGVDSDGSFNFSLNPFMTIGAWDFELGYALFGGNEDLNKPAWGYRYFTNVLYDDLGAVEIVDYNSLYGTEETSVLFGRVGFHKDSWSTSFSAAYYSTDNNPTEDEVLELQLGGAVKCNKHINVGGRLVSLISDENTGVSEQDRHYFEAWIAYTF